MAGFNAVAVIPYSLAIAAGRACGHTGGCPEDRVDRSGRVAITYSGIENVPNGLLAGCCVASSHLAVRSTLAWAAAAA